jgi:hypothetical protein
MEQVMAICMGLGLSAACGFRVFVPLLVISVASYSGHLELSEGFAWIGTPPALIAFSVATGLEIAGYYVPWVDNLLDTVATPAAVVAGTIVTASMVTDMSPFLKWTLAVVAGGGLAATVQGATVVARGALTAGTGGLANPVFATAEWGGSLLTSVLAVVFAPLAILVVAIGFYAVGRRILPKARRNPMVESAVE